MGIHVEMDERLLHRPDGRRFLSPLLQPLVFGVVESLIAQNCGTVPQLRGHPNEFPRISRHAEAAYQSNATQTVQGNPSADWYTEVTYFKLHSLLIEKKAG